jgi:hypothetical protein
MEDNTENLTKSPEPLQSLEQVLSRSLINAQPEGFVTNYSRY